ncbi:MAG: hypothetical protein JXB88_01610 [Spirochaetales bacterium]|nr:hypothetical protein [Spirochaetales bacterium]
MLNLIHKPTVSIVLFPISEDTHEELFINCSNDYSIGKLFREGLDAVYGFLPIIPDTIENTVFNREIQESNILSREEKKIMADAYEPSSSDFRKCTGKYGKIIIKNILSKIKFSKNREYNPACIRKNLKTIQAHINEFTGKEPGKTILFSQGHGNLGLNNWAVAYINDKRNRLPISFLIPQGEPVHERIYPSFIKYKKKHYKITDIMYFYNNINDLEEVSYEQVKNHMKKPAHNETVHYHECSGIYLPVWKNEYGATSKSKTIFTCFRNRDRRLVYEYEEETINSKTGDSYSKSYSPNPLLIDEKNNETILKEIFFVKLPTDENGIIRQSYLQNILITEVYDYDIHEDKVWLKKMMDVEYCFFGIPVHDLSPGEQIDKEMVKIIHFFYDLRHLFDLCQINIKGKELGMDMVNGDKDFPFYLFEYSLKENNFLPIYELLDEGKPVLVDLNKLKILLSAYNAPSGLQNKMKKMTENLSVEAMGVLQKIFKQLGYNFVNDKNRVINTGDIYFETNNNTLVNIVVKPVRNVYVYSFIGIIKLKQHNTYEEIYNDALIFAAVSGISGIRREQIKNKITDNIHTPIKLGENLEKAVEEIKKILSNEIFYFSDGKTASAGFLDPEWQLLLLDQGGDVHQRLWTDNVKDIIGSYNERKEISCELIIAT